MSAARPSVAGLLVRAEAHWAEIKSKVPVAGEAWFAFDPGAPALAGAGLLAWLERAREAYPSMFAAVERVEGEPDGGAWLRLRPVEVFEDDLGGQGLGPLRQALVERARLWGMWAVASVNAAAGAPALHGMPLDRAPRDLEPARLVALLDELALLGVGAGAEAAGASRL